jgi:hypothetical protein
MEYFMNKPRLFSLLLVNSFCFVSQSVCSAATIASVAIPGPNPNLSQAYVLPGQNIIGTISSAWLPGSRINSPITSAGATLPGTNLTGIITSASLPGTNVTGTIMNATLPGTNVTGVITSASFPGAHVTGSVLNAAYAANAGTAASAVYAESANNAKSAQTAGSATTASSLNCYLIPNYAYIAWGFYYGNKGQLPLSDAYDNQGNQLITAITKNTVCPYQKYALSFDLNWYRSGSCGGSDCRLTVEIKDSSGSSLLKLDNSPQSPKSVTQNTNITGNWLINPGYVLQSPTFSMENASTTTSSDGKVYGSSPYSAKLTFTAS